MQRRRPDISKMRNVLKRDPISLEEGIKRMIKDIEEKNCIVAGRMDYERI